MIIRLFRQKKPGQNNKNTANTAFIVEYPSGPKIYPFYGYVNQLAEQLESGIDPGFHGFGSIERLDDPENWYLTKGWDV